MDGNNIKWFICSTNFKAYYEWQKNIVLLAVLKPLAESDNTNPLDCLTPYPRPQSVGFIINFLTAAVSSLSCSQCGLSLVLVGVHVWVWAPCSAQTNPQALVI